MNRIETLRTLKELRRRRNDAFIAAYEWHGVQHIAHGHGDPPPAGTEATALCGEKFILKGVPVGQTEVPHACPICDALRKYL